MTFSLFRYLLLVATVTVLGCQKDTSIRWKEDVLLNDGRVVTLDRYQEFKGPHEIGQPPTESDYWFELVHPDTGEKVRWKGDRIHATVALISNEKSLYLLTMVTFDGWIRLGCPDPGFLLWQWRDANWHRVAMEQIPVRRVQANMTVFPASMRDKGLIQNGGHAPVGSTQSATYNFRPLLLSFESIKTQTFGADNCAVERGLLPDPYIVRKGM